MRTPRSLPSSRDFQRVLGRGRQGRSGGIVAVLAPNDEAEATTRLGLAVRSSDGAVARNRIKRRLRGAYGRIDVPLGYDIVVRADDRVRAGEFASLVEDLEAAVAKARDGLDQTARENRDGLDQTARENRDGLDQTARERRGEHR